MGLTQALWPTAITRCFRMGWEAMVGGRRGRRGWDRPDWARGDLLSVRAGGPSRDQLVSLHHLTHMQSGASLVAQTVKNLPAMQKTRV